MKKRDHAKKRVVLERLQPTPDEARTEMYWQMQLADAVNKHVGPINTLVGAGDILRGVSLVGNKPFAARWDGEGYFIDYETPND